MTSASFMFVILELHSPVLIHFHFIQKTGQDVLPQKKESHTGLERHDGE